VAGIGAAKPRLFIASSKEGEDFANALHFNLRSVAEATVWSKETFNPSRATLANLVGLLDRYDAAAFIFSPDDVLSIRGQTAESVRDNVIFEAGLFMGRLSPDRCFLVAPEGHPFHLPTDLLGVQMMLYEAERSDENWRAALAIPADDIKTALKALTRKPIMVPSTPSVPFEVRVVASTLRVPFSCTPSRHDDELLAACSTEDVAKETAEVLQTKRGSFLAVWHFEPDTDAPITSPYMKLDSEDPRWRITALYPF